ncbi:MAG: cbb3-type cytochrome c oxidase N-terminal domain-containing protein, partial [Alcaligenaceae bacterium]|nr:cbb3-type cytochrome c oxidase N-terminal domain-containing protein [Alcaligenaceae bacterium]
MNGVFLNSGWTIWISSVTILGLIFVLLLIATNRSWVKTKLSKDQVQDTGHEWDGIKELNNPCPRWWVVMYIGVTILGATILVLYPALFLTESGKGFRNWSSNEEVQQEQEELNAKMKPIYAQFDGKSIEEMASMSAAQDIGRRLFLNNCSQCHQSDAKGAANFPNLTDKDWLYGGAPARILQTITKGRHGVMPGFKAVLKPDQAADTAEYVRSLSGLKHDA